MPLYDVSVDFTLETEIDCDLGYRAFDQGGTLEFSDESYFSTQSVEADGGDLRFAVEASSEEEAEEKANEVISDGMEVEDGNGLTWLVMNVSYNVELREIPMDLDRATSVIQVFLADHPLIDGDVQEAVSFLMDTVTDQARRAVELAATITELRSEIRRLSEPEIVSSTEISPGLTVHEVN